MITLEELTDAEKKLVEAVQRGEVADYRSGDDEQDKLENVPQWGPERNLRGSVIRALCAGTIDDVKIDPRGIRIAGARITGPFSLDSCDTRLPLALFYSVIEQKFALRDARLVTLNLTGTHCLQGISADRVIIIGSVFLQDGFRSKGPVRFLSAEIGSAFICRDGYFENEGDICLSLDSCLVKGSIFLDKGFVARGQVRLHGADVKGHLDCTDGRFNNKNDRCLSADSANIKGTVFLNGDAEATGEVRFCGAEIGGNLECSNGSFTNLKGYCISADGTTIAGNVQLKDDFTSSGGINLIGARIGGNLECTGANLKNKEGYSLLADGAVINGNVFLRKEFKSTGTIRLTRAKIGGNLECTNGRFSKPDGDALFADGITVTGSVFLRHGFKSRGTVRLTSAVIGSTLECSDSLFERPGDMALSLESTEIKGTIIWRGVKTIGGVSFQGAHAHLIADEAKSWPAVDSLDLDGFTYDGFIWSETPLDAESRINWIRRQWKGSGFRPQPYEQLIKVLRKIGHEEDARKVAIAKQDALLESGLLTRGQKIWATILGHLVDYGYRPWKVLRFALWFWIFGTFLFYLGQNYGALSPTDYRIYQNEAYMACQSLPNRQRGDCEQAATPDDYTKVYPPLYSLDVFLPIVNLHQEEKWLPNTRSPLGWIVWVYMWIQIGAGWVLTSILVAALSGIIKKD